MASGAASGCVPLFLRFRPGPLASWVPRFPRFTRGPRAAAAARFLPGRLAAAVLVWGYGRPACCVTTRTTLRCVWLGGWGVEVSG